MHVDCDAFYAAVEQLERPELKELPFAVGGGVLTTCNYVARKFGCRSGMAGFVAKKLCPQLILIKPNFYKYAAKAQEIREVLADYDARFESASVDEAYLNITEYCERNAMEPSDAVEQMRREIYERTSITVSAGIAANTKLAKICSNMNKPNGQYLLPNTRNDIVAFMRDLPTRKVNGIGRVLERELLEIGVKTCGDLFGQRQYLKQLFGEKAFGFLLTCLLGLGRTRVQSAEEFARKSVGTESTFGETSDPVCLRGKLRSTAEELEKDMKRAECKGRTLCLKVKLHTFDVLTRQAVTPRAICRAADIYSYALPMLAKLEQDMPGMKLRLMGLRCSHLTSSRRPDTMAFFGFKQRAAVSEDQDGRRKRKASEARDDQDESDKDLVSEPCLSEGGESLHSASARHDGEPDALHCGRHGKEVVPNPRKPESGSEEDWWDCPVCLRPQAADERRFNQHMDLCLSRQAIREAAQQDEPEMARPSTAQVKRPKLAERRRRRPPATDPRQSKISFG